MQEVKVRLAGDEDVKAVKDLIVSWFKLRIKEKVFFKVFTG